mgnify:CR=1 FL=1
MIYLKYTVKMIYDEYVEKFKREPNLSGVAWIIKEKHSNQAAHLKMIMAFNGYELREAPEPKEAPEYGLFDEKTEWEIIVNGKEDDIIGPVLTGELQCVIYSLLYNY